MLLEIEQKCLEVCKKKVDAAKHRRAQLQQEIAVSEAEPADICSATGEQSLNVSMIRIGKPFYKFEVFQFLLGHHG